MGRFFRQARHELREAKSDIVRQAEETKLLLQETAQRHMDAEKSADGKAFFSPACCHARFCCLLTRVFWQVWLSRMLSMAQPRPMTLRKV